MLPVPVHLDDTTGAIFLSFFFIIGVHGYRIRPLGGILFIHKTPEYLLGLEAPRH